METEPTPRTRQSGTADEVQPFRARNLVAVFDDPGHARETLAALERHRVDGSRLSFVGDSGAPSNADARFAGLTLRRLLQGGVAGILAGLVFGVIIAFVLEAAISADSGYIWSASLVGFAAMGAAVGSFYTLFAATASSKAWRETFNADPRGSAYVVVHLADDEDPDELRELVADHEPRQVRFVGRHGRPLGSLPS